MQWGPVGETRAYDIVLDVAKRVQQFQRRNLRLQGPWVWLLSEFASCYGVSESYTKLRYREHSGLTNRNIALCIQALE